MNLRIALSAIVLAATVVAFPADEAGAVDKLQQKAKEVSAQKLKLEKARDAMHDLADMKAPKTLTAEQKKTYDREMDEVEDIADETDTVIKKIDAAKSDLNSLSELGEMESLRIQKAMDQFSKKMLKTSDLLEEHSDVARKIQASLK